MAKVKYEGTSHFREILKISWENVGVLNQEDVVWDRDAGTVHDISQQAWEYLQSTPEADFFKLVAPESPPEVTDGGTPDTPDDAPALTGRTRGTR